MTINESARCPSCGRTFIHCGCPGKVADLACGERVDVDCGSLPVNPTIELPSTPQAISAAPAAVVAPAVESSAAATTTPTPTPSYASSFSLDQLAAISAERLRLLQGTRQAHAGYMEVVERQMKGQREEIKSLRLLLGRCVDYVEGAVIDLENEVDFEYSHTEAQRAISSQLREARELLKSLQSVALTTPQATNDIAASAATLSSITPAPEADHHVTTTQPTTTATEL